MFKFKYLMLALAATLLAACTDADFSSKPESSSTIYPTDDFEFVKEVCEKKPKQTFTRTLDFPADDRNCEWGQNGNLNKLNAHVQARREQERSFSLPPNAVLCDVDFDFSVSSSSGTFFYDDFFILSFNDVVLVSPIFLYRYFPQNELGLSVYDWSSIKGKTHPDFDPNIPGNEEINLCFGNDTVCQIPDHDDKNYAYGQLGLIFNPEIFMGIMAQDLERTTHTFGITITADDNDGTAGNTDQNDCYHSGVSFEVKATYVEKN